jgi:hypothetical protein
LIWRWIKSATGSKNCQEQFLTCAVCTAPNGVSLRDETNNSRHLHQAKKNQHEPVPIYRSTFAVKLT